MRPRSATGGHATAAIAAGDDGSLKPFSATRTLSVSHTNGTATTPNCIVSSSVHVGFGVWTCFCVAVQYAQSRTTAYPRPGTPNRLFATATLRSLSVLTKPICKNAAVGTPARHPMVVATDQPPETSLLGVAVVSAMSRSNHGVSRCRSPRRVVRCRARASAVARGLLVAAFADATRRRKCVCVASLAMQALLLGGSGAQIAASNRCCRSMRGATGNVSTRDAA
mmetsp:Transcript_5090/g.14969  ORF Transcript_5090/g.14969 Transcript_5090/m.14969 type:complete len:224 (+) Transcript_5090:374-1045(+)